MGVKFTNFPGESLIVKCGPNIYLRVRGRRGREVGNSIKNPA